MHLMVVRRARHEVAIDRVRDPAHFLIVNLLMGEALLHVEVPDRD